MKISFNWLKNYININESPEQIADLLTQSGLEVEGSSAYEQIPGGMEGLVIGEVISSEKHPNADKLKITNVNIGNGAVSPIVCGAPNVAAGQKVVVATVGSTLYPTGGIPFKIKKAKIRGEVSEGMICAEDEIGLGESHEGIMVLDTDEPVGTPASEYFNISSDTIFEIGLTPNRGDATSHIGVARDLKALLSREIKYPDIDNFKADNRERPIEVIVENKEACPRYSGLTISGLTVKESPEWLKTKLQRVGLSPINNVVDVTNFVLYELGQPLHAFDADEINGNKVIVKTLPAGSSFTTLDEKERKLTAEDLMICNETGGMCIAGVFGGVKSGVKPGTKNIFLESAYFSPDFIRKTAQHHGLKTDASFRYERGTDPNITVYALKRAGLLIKEVAGGQISSEVIDVYSVPVQNFEVAVLYKNINRLIGKIIGKDQIKSILNSLDIQLSNESEEGFTAFVPPYRVDVQREEDVIEEILRIYGYNNIAIPEHISSDYLAGFPAIDRDLVQNRTAELLAASGFNEIITNSLTKPLYAEKSEAFDPASGVQILNKLSEDLAVLRQTLLFSGLEVIAYNINRRQHSLKFFEFGKSYQKIKKYKEQKHLAIYLTGHNESETWMQATRDVQFHDLAAIVYKILRQFNITVFESEEVYDSIFAYGLKVKINDKPLVTFGKVNQIAAALTNVNQEVFYADFLWKELLKLSEGSVVYEEVPKFPEVRRDLSLVLDKKVSFTDIQKITQRSEFYLIKRINVFDLYEGENIDKNKKAYALSFILQDKTKTLTDKIIDKVMNKLMHIFENELDAMIRK